MVVEDVGAQVKASDGTQGTIDKIEFAWGALFRSPKDILKIGEELKVLIYR